MARIHKLVKSWGAQTIGTSRISLETQTIKPLGDMVSWAIYMSTTTVKGTGTLWADGGTPSGSWLGSNTQRLFNRIQIKDNQNGDVFDAKRNEMYILSYLLSTVESDEAIFNKGGVKRPVTQSGDITALTEVYFVPQRIALKDLPATVSIELGVLADYYNSVSNGTITVNQIEFWCRYVPATQDSYTERCKVFQVASFSSNTDLAYLIPQNIEISRLGYLCADITATSGAPAAMVNTNVDYVGFKRGSNDEIDTVRRQVIDEFNARIIPNLLDNNGSFAEGPPSGLTIIPTLAFVKTTATEWKFTINTAISPAVFYVYK